MLDVLLDWITARPLYFWKKTLVSVSIEGLVILEFGAATSLSLILGCVKSKDLNCLELVVLGSKPMVWGWLKTASETQSYPSVDVNHLFSVCSTSIKPWPRKSRGTFKPWQGGLDKFRQMNDFVSLERQKQNCFKRSQLEVSEATYYIAFNGFQLSNVSHCFPTKYQSIHSLRWLPNPSTLVQVLGWRINGRG